MRWLCVCVLFVSSKLDIPSTRIRVPSLTTANHQRTIDIEQSRAFDQPKRKIRSAQHALISEISKTSMAAVFASAALLTAFSEGLTNCTVKLITFFVVLMTVIPDKFTLILINSFCIGL